MSRRNKATWHETESVSQDWSGGWLSSQPEDGQPSWKSLTERARRALGVAVLTTAAVKQHIPSGEARVSDLQDEGALDLVKMKVSCKTECGAITVFCCSSGSRHRWKPWSLFDQLYIPVCKTMLSMTFQAFGSQKKAFWWVPSQLPPGQRRPSSGLPEDARAEAHGSSRARTLQQALPPQQASPAAGPSLPAGSQVSPELPLLTRAACRAQRHSRTELEQQENIKGRHGCWWSLDSQNRSSQLERKSTLVTSNTPLLSSPSDTGCEWRHEGRSVSVTSMVRERYNWNEHLYLNVVTPLSLPWYDWEECVWMLSPVDYFLRRI